MRVAITGGTGFMGSHLGQRLVEDGNEVVLVSRTRDGPGIDLLASTDAEFAAASGTDRSALRPAFAGCDAVAHLAGINFERGAQTFEAVHVRGTENAVAAAEAIGASTIALSTFLRARPDCGSAYHESKWQAEQIVRESTLDHAVLKAGGTYGRGDHLLTHVARALRTLPVFALVGFGERRLRPLSVADLVDAMTASLTGNRLVDATVPVVGPEELTLEATVRRIGTAVGREPVTVPLPTRVVHAGAWGMEQVMDVPVVARAQVRILDEGVVEPAPIDVCEPLPEDLQPERAFTQERIEHGLGDVRRFGPGDLRW